MNGNTNNGLKNYSSKYATTSLVLALIPYIVSIFPLIIIPLGSQINSPDKTSYYTVKEFFILFMFGYYITVGILFAIISIVTGIIGLQTEKRKTAIISLVIKLIALIIFTICLIDALTNTKPL